jgi:peptidoglycan/xylan/chitin deacetylase (PgdA/CDA1 family)
MGSKLPARQVVLYYHAVPTALRGSFGRQMDQLLRMATIVQADYRGPLSSGCRYVSVTFDDAFVSVIENALPELQRRRIPCTIFVPTGCLGYAPSWISSAHPDACQAVASREMLAALASDSLVMFGSHSVSHPDFRSLDDESARAELVKSKSELESLLKRNVGLFSFPHGAFKRRSLELARESGYSRVFTIEPTTLAGDEEVCGRVRVEPDDWLIELRLKATGAYRWLAPASAWKRRIRNSATERRKLASTEPGTVRWDQ